MKLSEELAWRGFVDQTTLKDLGVLDGDPIVFYHGFDASADSQTIGNLAAMMLDLLFLRHGHKGIVLAGGATSLIGDAGGKDKERALQPEEEISKNVANAESQIKSIFGDHDFALVNNLDWFKDMTAIEFLRDIGKHFSVGQLIQRDFIKTRLGQDGTGISYAEFSYTIMQGYDFLYLYDKYGTTLQLAGADQWGNALSGVELVRKTRDATVNVLTLPLVINKTTGVKFGKSEEGAVWLDSNKTSVYKFYQFWLNTDDAGVIDYLKIYTTLPKEEIDRLEQEVSQNPSARIAQRTLAREVTTIVHGADRTASVERVTTVLFDEGDIAQLSTEDIEILASEIPVTTTGKHLVEVMIATDLASSNNEARRLLESGAVSINGVKALDDVLVNDISIVKKGKNSFALVR